MRDREEDRLLHPLRAGEQEVHRPVQLVIGDRVDPREDDVAAQPAGRLQLRGRLQAALADHREDRPLHPGAAATAGRRPARSPCRSPAPTTAASSTCGPPDFRRRPGTRNPSGVHARSVSSPPRKRWIDPHQPHQRLPVQLVLAAEVVDHPRHRHTALVALVVRQLQVAHRLAPPRPPRRRPQIHDAYTMTPLPRTDKRTQVQNGVPTRFRAPTDGETAQPSRIQPLQQAGSPYLVRNSGRGCAQPCPWGCQTRVLRGNP